VKPLYILLVYDHRLFRKGVVRLLNARLLVLMGQQNAAGDEGASPAAWVCDFDRLERDFL